MGIETHDEPLTLQSLRALIESALAYPFAWQKFGLGEGQGRAVASFCRDRAAQIATEVWDRMQATEDEANERVQR